jgi:hypothetical protein
MNISVTDNSITDVAVPPLPMVPEVPENVLRTAKRLGIADQLPPIITLSRELFGNSLTLRVAEDPELDNWTHIVVEAAVSGTAEEMVARERQWCRRVVQQGLSHWFNLSTYYDE